MAFPECIAAALAAGEIDDTYAHRARAIYDEQVDEFQATMPRAEAMAEAARSAHRFLDGEAAETRRRAFLSLAARRDIMERLDGYRAYGSGAPDPFKGATGLFDRLLPGRGGFAIEQQRYYWRNAAHATMDRAFEAFRPNWLLRRRNVPLMQNVVRELFGAATGDDAARTLARSWTDAAEMLRSNFNRFGGHIGLLENWGLPQGHDGRAIVAAGFAEWRDFIAPLLDLNRMRDVTENAAFADFVPGVIRETALTAALRHVYDQIVTDGWSTRVASGAGGRARANTRADARFLIFRDGDAWMAYQGRFGEPDPFNAMMRHIDGLARDIAMMQVLGPNPASTVRWLGQELDRRRALSGADPDRVTNAMNTIETMYDMTTGRAYAPTNARVASIGATFGNYLTAVQLGGAILAAVPGDIMTQSLTRRLNGMPTVRLLGTMLQQLNPANPEHRLAAIRLGAGAQSFGSVLIDQARYVGELQGHRWSRVLADRVLAYTGLSPWTEAGRAAYFADALGTIADRSDRAWADLPAAFRDGLARYRIGEAEWEAIRTTPHYRAMDATFIRPEDIANRADLDPARAMDLAQRLADYAGSETEFAVPSGSLAGRALARGRNPPGNPTSLFTDSVLKYKNFALTMMMGHGRRLVSQGTLQRRGAYAGALILTSTIAGAITVQMKELLNFRDPRDMEDPRFWMAALAQGGGTALIGDFAYSGLTGAARTGGGLAETMAGPGVGKVAETFRALFGVPMSPSQDDAGARAAANLVELTKRSMVGGSAWFARGVLERYIFDAIQEEIDPGWKRRVRSIESWYSRQHGNGFWWKRGDQPGLDDTAIRAPDFSTALAGNRP